MDFCPNMHEAYSLQKNMARNFQKWRGQDIPGFKVPS
jgi:hypothetical protein